MIRFDQVTKKFGPVVALDHISFNIDPGEFVFITGPSGAGKTTLARLMVKEYIPDEGDIYIGEYHLNQIKNKEIPGLRQQIGVIFQDFKLLPDRTAAENIALSLEIINKSTKAIEATVNELLKVIKLEGRGHLFPRQLSGGEIQRVVIARSLAIEPAVIFADEPTGNLDMDTAWEIMSLLESINAEGTTIIMSTHNQNIIDALNKRVIKLNHGSMIEDTKTSSEEKSTEKESKHHHKKHNNEKESSSEKELVANHSESNPDDQIVVNDADESGLK